MEWYELLGKMLPVVFWVVPVVLLVALAAFVLLAPILYLAGVVLRLYEAAHGIVRVRLMERAPIARTAPLAPTGERVVRHKAVAHEGVTAREKQRRVAGRTLVGPRSRVV